MGPYGARKNGYACTRARVRVRVRRARCVARLCGVGVCDLDVYGVSGWRGYMQNACVAWVYAECVVAQVRPCVA